MIGENNVRLASQNARDACEGYQPIVKMRALTLGVYRCSGAPARTDEEAAPFPEVVLPQAGAYIRRDCGGAAYLDRTTIGFFEAGRPYTIEHPMPCPDVTTVISLIAPEMLSDALGLRNGAPLFGCSAVRASPEIQIMHRHLVRRLTAADHIEIEERTIELAAAAVALASARSNEIARIDDRSDIALAIADRLQETFLAKVTIDELADSVGLSAFHVCRVFKARMGMTIHSYLARLRFEYAVELLTTTDAPITNIALESGFSSHAHFTSAFSRWAGMAPSTVRKLGAVPLR